jgi:hypothetical protein
MFVTPLKRAAVMQSSWPFPRRKKFSVRICSGLRPAFICFYGLFRLGSGRLDSAFPTDDHWHTWASIGSKRRPVSDRFGKRRLCFGVTWCR